MDYPLRNPYRSSYGHIEEQSIEESFCIYEGEVNVECPEEMGEVGSVPFEDYN
jgi:hypothetical protein